MTPHRPQRSVGPPLIPSATKWCFRIRICSGSRYSTVLENTPPNVDASKPKRVIEGPDTKNEYNNGLYIDPKNGETYNVAMDTADAIFTYRRRGLGKRASPCES